MNDLQDDVRDLLSRKAGELPPHLDVPPSLPKRVRRRVAWNAVAVGATVALIAVGLVAGIRTFSPTATRVPEAQPTVSEHASLTPCTASQLRAVAAMGGAAGSREGTIDVTNGSGTTCTLEDAPALTLLDQNLDPITSGITFDETQAGWQVDGKKAPEGWPVVTLAPEGSASVRIRWSNWCLDGGATPIVRMTMPGGDVTVSGLDVLGAPPCNGPELPSTIEIGPFEPA